MGDDLDAARIFRLNLQLSTETLLAASAEITALGLEPKAFFVLDALETRPYPAELSRHLSMPKPTMTSYLKALEARAWIVRALESQDLRRHRLELTDAGRDVLTRARRHLYGRYGDRLLRLSQEEREAFAATLQTLVG